MVTKTFKLNLVLPVGADVEGDGEELVRGDAREGGVESELAHGDAHALGPQVPQAEDPLAVRHHDGPHVILRPVLEDIIDMALVVDGDEEALGTLERQTKLLARQAHSRGVDYRHELHGVLREELVEQLLVPVEQVHQVHVLVEGVLVSTQVPHTVLSLETRHMKDYELE